MVINVKKEDIFIPEYNGNQEQPDAEQIKIYHRFLSTAERERYIYLKNYTEGSAAKLLASKEADDMEDIFVEYSREFVQDSKGIALAIITKIENLSIDYGDGQKEAVETIEGFYELPDAFPTLRAEVEAYVLNLSAKVDPKN